MVNGVLGKVVDKSMASEELCLERNVYLVGFRSLRDSKLVPVCRSVFVALYTLWRHKKFRP